jgi:hypothetical protein
MPVKRFTRGQILTFFGFVSLCVVWYFVSSRFGQTEGFRFWGVVVIGTAIFFTFSKAIPVHVGDRQVGLLAGWRKAFALVPMYLIGITVTVFPHEAACAVALRGHVCP